MATIIDRLKRQVERGEQVIAGSFNWEEWRAGSTMLLEQALSKDAALVEDFKGISYSLGMSTNRTPDRALQDARDAGIRRGISHVMAAIEHLESSTSTFEDAWAVDPDLWTEIEALVSSRKWHQVASNEASGSTFARPSSRSPQPNRIANLDEINRYVL